jgi:hypothetical protein
MSNEFEIDEEQQAAFERGLKPIEEKVNAAVRASGRRCVVIYSAYDCDDKGVPTDNLDAVAVEGFGVFRAERDIYFGGEKSKTYWSGVLFNPTFLELGVLANAAILRTRDLHHRFFEGVREGSLHSLHDFEVFTKKFGRDVKLYDMFFGS